MQIEPHIIEQSRELWNPSMGRDRDGRPMGNKVQAIKYLREELGLSLKEAKDMVENDFAGVDTDGTPGYHIDKIFELGKELAYHYQKLESLGFTFGSKK